jgi:hypothetical protein
MQAILLIVQPTSYTTGKNQQTNANIYERISKIFRTDGAKIIKLTIRPVGRHYPRSSSLPHVDIAPIISSTSGTFPGSRFLSVSSTLRFGLDLLNGIKPASFQLQFFFVGNRKKSLGALAGDQGGTVGGG